MKAWVVLVLFGTEQNAREAAMRVTQQLGYIALVSRVDVEKLRIVNPELN